MERIKQIKALSIRGQFPLSLSRVERGEGEWGVVVGVGVGGKFAFDKTAAEILFFETEAVFLGIGWKFQSTVERLEMLKQKNKNKKQYYY